MTEKLQKVAIKFLCETCDYNTCRKSSYDKHLMTAKHHKMTLLDKKLQKVAEVEPYKNSLHICVDCSKKYKTRGGLWAHKKKCSPIVETKLEPGIENTMTLTTSHIDNNLIVELIKQNGEILKQLAEIVKEPRTYTNNNNHSNNKTFNLQFFLNETCKNAMNVSEFVENIKIDFDDVENLGNTGYVKGITDIIVKNLHTLGITERPFHCTDTKRETIYIKDNDAWNKDTEEKTKFKAVLKEIANKNLDATKDWTQQHPEVRVLDSEENKMYLKLFEQVICVKEENNPKYHEKVIKNMMNSIKLDKNTT